jgi:hypothetical protein
MLKVAVSRTYPLSTNEFWINVAKLKIRLADGSPSIHQNIVSYPERWILKAYCEQHRMTNFAKSIGVDFTLTTFHFMIFA